MDLRLFCFRVTICKLRIFTRGDKDDDDNRKFYKTNNNNGEDKLLMKSSVRQQDRNKHAGLGITSSSFSLSAPSGDVHISN